MRKIGRFEADISDYLWRRLQKIDGHSVGRVEVNPESIERKHRVVDESAASFRSGEFVSIASNPFCDRDHFSNEAGDLGHGQRSLPLQLL